MVKSSKKMSLSEKSFHLTTTNTKQNTLISTKTNTKYNNEIFYKKLVFMKKMSTPPQPILSKILKSSTKNEFK